MLNREAIVDEVLIALRQIIRTIDLHSKRISKKIGITGPQLLVLKAIPKVSNPNLKKVAEHVKLSSATVSLILDKLMEKGYIIRQPHLQDKRITLLALTEKGQETIKNSPSLLQDEFIDAFGKLEAWEQTLILSSLQRVATMMKADDLPVSPLLMSEEMQAGN